MVLPDQARSRAVSFGCEPDWTSFLGQPPPQEGSRLGGDFQEFPVNSNPSASPKAILQVLRKSQAGKRLRSPTAEGASGKGRA
jgi:hypothetical protein